MKFISIEEAAKKIGKSYGYVRKRIETGEIKAIKLNTTYRIPEEAIEEFKKNVKSELVDGLSISDLAKKLEVSYALANSLVKNGEINAVKDGRRYVVPEEEYKRFLNEKLSDKSIGNLADHQRQNESNMSKNENDLNCDKDSSNIDGIMESIKSLSDLLKTGAITEDEFKIMKKRIINKL